MRIFILSAVLIATTNLFGQFSRTFFNSDRTQSFEEAYALKVGNDNLLFHVYEDTLNDQIALKIGTVNDLGDLNSVTKTSLVSNVTNISCKVTGVSVNLDGSYNVSIIYGYGSYTFNYAVYNVLNGVVTSNYIFPSPICSGFIKSMNVGNEIVTYLVSTNDGLIRISNLISNIQSASVEIVDATNIFNTQNQSGIRSIDFIETSGIEYVVTRVGKVYKRSSSNNYTNSVISGFSSVPNFDLVKQNNNILLFSDTVAYSFDSNLQLNQTYSFNYNSLFNCGYIKRIEAISVNNNLVVFYGGNYAAFSVELNNNLQIVNSQILPNSFSVNSISLVSGGNYLVSGTIVKKGGDVFSSYSPLNCFLILGNQLLGINDFIEYAQVLKQNNISMNVANGDKLMYNDYDGDNLARCFEWNTDSASIATIFGSVNYVVGKNNFNQIVGNGNAPYAIGLNFIVGPLTTNYGDFDIFQSKYNRGYFVSKQMIQQHLANLQNGTPNYIAPFGIREWPAHGDVTLGQALNLAEFIDVNNNGVYEPYNGDYPAIYGDECLLTLQHKVDSVNGTKLEWYNYFHVYNCDSSEAEANTVFLRSIYVNYGDSIHDAYMTNYTDFDLGNYTDDYLGTNVKNGLIYVINGDEYDENWSGLKGFGMNIPTMGIQILEGAKFQNDSLDNSFGVDTNQCANGFGFGDGVIDNEYTTLESSIFYIGASTFPFSDPVNDVQFYNASQGLLVNGAPITYGSQGQGTGVISKYCYPGTSDSLGYGTHGQILNNEWSEFSDNNPAGDRRAIGSTGKFNLGHNKSVSFLQAFTIAFDTVNHTPEFSSKKLFEYAAILRDEYGNDSSACGGNFQKIRADLSVTEKTMLDFNVYPNPFNSSLIVDGLKSNSGQINVIGLDGKVFFTKNISNLKEEIQLDFLNDGLYLIQIINSGQTVVKKVIKR